MLILDSQTILNGNEITPILCDMPATETDQALAVDYFRPLFSPTDGTAIGSFYGIGGKYYYVKDRFTPGAEAQPARYRNGNFIAAEPARLARFDYDLDSTIEVDRPEETKEPIEEPDDTHPRVKNAKILDAIEEHIVLISGKSEIFIRRDSKTYRVVPAKTKILANDAQNQPTRPRKVA